MIEPSQTFGNLCQSFSLDIQSEIIEETQKHRNEEQKVPLVEVSQSLGFLLQLMIESCQTFGSICQSFSLDIQSEIIEDTQKHRNEEQKVPLHCLVEVS